MTVVYCVAAGALLPDPADWPEIWRTQVAPLVAPTDKKPSQVTPPPAEGAADTTMQPADAVVKHEVNGVEETAAVKPAVNAQGGAVQPAAQGAEGDAPQAAQGVVAMDTDAVAAGEGDTEKTQEVDVKTEGAATEGAPDAAAQATVVANDTQAADGTAQQVPGEQQPSGEQQAVVTEEVAIPDPFLLLRCKRTKSCTWKAVVISLDGLLDYDQQVCCGGGCFCCSCCCGGGAFCHG